MLWFFFNLYVNTEKKGVLDLLVYWRKSENHKNFSLTGFVVHLDYVISNIRLFWILECFALVFLIEKPLK